MPIREKRALPEECDTNIREIYEILSEIPINADEIAARTQKNPAEVLTALSELEIRDLYRQMREKDFVSASKIRHQMYKIWMLLR